MKLKTYQKLVCKILFLSSLVTTTYSEDFGHSPSPFSYNVVNSKYFAITAGISNNSNFLSLRKTERSKRIKAQFAIIFNKDTVPLLNILSIAQTIFDINIILRPSQYFYISWQVMTRLRQGLYQFNFQKDEATDYNTKKTLFLMSYVLPTFTFNIPYVTLHFDISQLSLYLVQLDYKKDHMKFYFGLFFSSFRLSPKIFNDYYGDVFIAKAIDLAFATASAYCFKDFSFKYWAPKNNTSVTIIEDTDPNKETF